MIEYPRLETERLILRKPSYHDIPEMIKHANDKDVVAGTLNMPHPYVEDNAIEWLNMSLLGFKTGEKLKFAIELKETGKFIGGIGYIIHARHNTGELGYWLGKPFWNKGYGTEALKAVLKYGFEELKLHKVFATHFPFNASSGKIMQKCGMVKEGEMKEHVKKGDTYLDLIQYGMTLDMYKPIKI